MGMGGSSLGAAIWASWTSQLKIPLIAWRQRQPPAFLDHQSALIVASYSGQTQETLQFCQRLTPSQQRQLSGLTSGGPLLAWLREKQRPYFLINPQLNPSGQPRHGVGFSLGFLASFFRDNHLLPPRAWQEWEQSVANFQPLTSAIFQQPDFQKLSQFLLQQPLTFIVTPPSLAGLGLFWRNQLRETGKQLSCFAAYPDLRHHLVEVLKNRPLTILLLKTKGYSFANFPAWLRRQKIPFFSLAVKGKTWASKILWGLNYGQYLALALAEKKGVNANKIDAIQWLKSHN